MGCLLNFISIIPILMAVNGILGNLAVLGIAWYNGSVNPTVQFPYMSICGNEQPASCFFSQVCNNGCILGLIFEVVIYQMNHAAIIDHASLAVGIISCLGLSVTGNFQASVFPNVHSIGALLAFVFGGIYLGLRIGAKKGGYCKMCGIVGLVIYDVLITIYLFLHFFQQYHYAPIFEWLAAMVFFLVYATFCPEFMKFRDKHSNKTLQDLERIRDELEIH